MDNKHLPSIMETLASFFPDARAKTVISASKAIADYIEHLGTKPLLSELPFPQALLEVQKMGIPVSKEILAQAHNVPLDTDFRRGNRYDHLSMDGSWPISNVLPDEDMTPPTISTNNRFKDVPAIEASEIRQRMEAHGISKCINNNPDCECKIDHKYRCMMGTYTSSKQCKSCPNILPLTKEFWPQYREGKFRPRCLKCWNTNRRTKAK